MNGRFLPRQPIEPPAPETVLTMFREGSDTAEIASHFFVREHVICSLLQRARDAERLASAA